MKSLLWPDPVERGTWVVNPWKEICWHMSWTCRQDPLGQNSPCSNCSRDSVHLSICKRRSLWNLILVFILCSFLTWGRKFIYPSTQMWGMMMYLFLRENRDLEKLVFRGNITFLPDSQRKSDLIILQTLEREKCLKGYCNVFPIAV